VLTLPADLAATAKPTSTKRNFVNHSLKLINELLACWQQHSPYNAGWACFDAAQGTRELAALLTTAPAEQVNQTDEAKAVDTPIDSNQWQDFVHHADYVLACAEAATRMWAARTNNTQPWEDLGDTAWEQVRGALHEKSECFHSLTSLIRLARACLQAPNKKLMAVVLVLFIANAVTTVWQYRTAEKQPDQGHILGGQTDGNTATTATTTPQPTAAVTQTAAQKLAAVQTHRPLGSNPELNIDDFATCIELYAQDLRQRNGHASISINFGTALDTWCQEHHITPFFQINGDYTPLVEPFNNFWLQVQNDTNGANRPFFMRQFFGQPYDTPNTGSTRDFCRRFAAFYQQAQQKVAATANTSGAMGSAPSGTQGNTAAPTTENPMPRAQVFMITPGHSLQGTTEPAHDTVSQAAAPSIVAAASTTASSDSPTAAPTRNAPPARNKTASQIAEENRNLARDSAARRRKPAAPTQDQPVPPAQDQAEAMDRLQPLDPGFVDPTTAPNS
jgi:hypothetical protein